MLLEQYQPEEEREKVREMNDAAYAFNGDLRPMVIMAKECYEETLEMVRRLMPVLILPGSDLGTELALRLSFDLKLKNNPPWIFWNIRDKRAMQEALKSAGLRFIRSYTICSEKDALRRYRAEEGRWVVIKPSQAAGSTGVYICGSEREVCEAYRVNSAFVRERNRKGEKVILQEYISGDEYAVDTISCKGRHVALFGMKYIKRRCNGFGKIYDTDLDTNGGMIYLTVDDPEIIDEDLGVIRRLEKEGLHELYDWYRT